MIQTRCKTLKSRSYVSYKKRIQFKLVTMRIYKSNLLCCVGAALWCLFVATGPQQDDSRQFVWCLFVATGPQHDDRWHFVSLSAVNRKCDNNLTHMAMVGGKWVWEWIPPKCFESIKDDTDKPTGKTGLNPSHPEKNKSWNKNPLQI